MLELAARHADAWNMAWFGLPDERLVGLRRELAEACQRVGRDQSTLAITVGINVRYPELPGASAEPPAVFLGGTPSEIAAGLRAHADAGADHLITVLDPCTPEAVGLFAEAVTVYRAG